MPQRTVEIDVTILRTTDAALLIEHEGEEYWIPRSQVIEDESDALEEGDEGLLTITEWIAIQKEIAC